MPLRPPVVGSRVTKGVAALDSGEMRAGTLAISTDASKVSTDTQTKPASTCQIDWGPRTMERPQRQQLGRLEANGVPLAWRTRSGGFLSHHPPSPRVSFPPHGTSTKRAPRPCLEPLGGLLIRSSPPGSAASRPEAHPPTQEERPCHRKAC